MPNPNLKPNTVLHQRYKISGVVAVGFQSAVYLAQDSTAGHAVVAIREFVDRAPTVQTEFQAQAAQLGNLKHESLTRVTDSFVEADGRQYLVTEFIEGVDLERLVRQAGRQSEIQVLRFAEMICDALVYLHSQTPPIFRVQLRPSSIIVSPSFDRVTLTGLWLHMPHVSSEALSSPADCFWAAELYTSGRLPYDARTNLYSVGAILYFVATGSPPPEAMHLLVFPADLKPPRTLAPDLSGATQELILKAMANKPEERFQTADEMLQAVRSAILQILPKTEVPCLHCGHRNRPGAKFCNHCGKPLVSRQIIDVAAPPPETPAPALFTPPSLGGGLPASGSPGKPAPAPAPPPFTPPIVMPPPPPLPGAAPTPPTSVTRAAPPAPPSPPPAAAPAPAPRPVRKPREHLQSPELASAIEDAMAGQMAPPAPSPSPAPPAPAAPPPVPAAQPTGFQPPAAPSAPAAPPTAAPVAPSPGVTSSPVPASTVEPAAITRFGRTEYYSPMELQREYPLRVALLLSRHGEGMDPKARVQWANLRVATREPEPVIRIVPSSGYMSISPPYHEVRAVQGQDVMAEFKLVPLQLPPGPKNECELTIDFEYRGQSIRKVKLPTRVQRQIRVGPFRFSHEQWRPVGLLGGLITIAGTITNVFQTLSTFSLLWLLPLLLIGVGVLILIAGAGLALGAAKHLVIPN